MPLGPPAFSENLPPYSFASLASFFRKSPPPPPPFLNFLFPPPTLSSVTFYFPTAFSLLDAFPFTLFLCCSLYSHSKFVQAYISSHFLPWLCPGSAPALPCPVLPAPSGEADAPPRPGRGGRGPRRARGEKSNI